MMQTFWKQSAINAPDLPIQPPSTGNGIRNDFACGVYAQLAQIQRDIGALSTAQTGLDAYVKESHMHFAQLARESELRLTKLGEESERRWIRLSEESEKRLTQLSRESEERFAARVEKAEERVEKLETGALERVKTTEDKLASLKDFVHRLFWTGTGVAAVLGVTLGWKPLWLWVSMHGL
jgi:ElaB/YqjD/DUF883 family membrane-anchored ribosome-binding protein